VLALAVLALLSLSLPQDGARAEWRCEPEKVELGEPFALVLELAHSAGTSGRELVAGTLSLDGSWALLEELPPVTDAAADGSLRTRRAWRVASLEPGERELAEALASFALPESVERIALGAARVSVSGVLAEGEDAPRPMREFPEGFADGCEAEAGRGLVPWLVAGAVLVLAATGFVLWRRRARRAAVPVGATRLERLRALEEGPPEAGRERCYELTRLLREAGDELAARPRDGLSDEEWLAEVQAAHALPGAAVGELAAVLERTTRVKYAGEAPTPWALAETFTRARAALEALGGGAVRA
jgi:hypothetical protein